jgi:hypothetical protein
MQNGNYLNFELLLSGEDVCREIISKLEKDNCIWINGSKNNKQVAKCYG